MTSGATSVTCRFRWSAKPGRRAEGAIAATGHLRRFLECGGLLAEPGGAHAVSSKGTGRNGGGFVVPGAQNGPLDGELALKLAARFSQCGSVE
jgi:hypothetical protein